MYAARVALGRTICAIWENATVESGQFNFYLDPDDFDLQALSTGIESITLMRVDGESRGLDVSSHNLSIGHAHPPVDRMADDLGAICSVFKDANHFTLTLNGVRLSPGDSLELTYLHRTYRVLIEVTDWEEGRAIIRPPKIIR